VEFLVGVANHNFVIHQRYRQTDRRTDGRTDDVQSQDRALHYSASHGKNGGAERITCSPNNFVGEQLLPLPPSSGAYDDDYY